MVSIRQTTIDIAIGSQSQARAIGAERFAFIRDDTEEPRAWNLKAHSRGIEWGVCAGKLKSLTDHRQNFFHTKKIAGEAIAVTQVTHVHQFDIAQLDIALQALSLIHI